MAQRSYHARRYVCGHVTRLHRNVNIAAVVLPFVAVLAAIPMLWNELIGWTDLLLFAVMYFVQHRWASRSASTGC